jgi:hypothetical protein
MSYKIINSQVEMITFTFEEESDKCSESYEYQYFKYAGEYYFVSGCEEWIVIFKDGVPCTTKGTPILAQVENPNNYIYLKYYENKYKCRDLNFKYAEDEYELFKSDFADELKKWYKIVNIPKLFTNKGYDLTIEYNNCELYESRYDDELTIEMVKSIQNIFDEV